MLSVRHLAWITFFIKPLLVSDNKVINIVTNLQVSRKITALRELIWQHYLHNLNIESHNLWRGNYELDRESNFSYLFQYAAKRLNIGRCESIDLRTVILELSFSVISTTDARRSHQFTWRIVGKERLRSAVHRAHYSHIYTCKQNDST